MGKVHVYIQNKSSNRKQYIFRGEGGTRREYIEKRGKMGFISIFHPSTNLSERKEGKEEGERENRRGCGHRLELLEMVCLTPGRQDELQWSHMHKRPCDDLNFLKDKPDDGKVWRTFWNSTCLMSECSRTAPVRGIWTVVSL